MRLCNFGPFLALVAIVAFAAAATPARAAVYTCMESGKKVFRDQPCAGAARLPAARAPAPTAKENASASGGTAAGGTPSDAALSLVKALRLADTLAPMGYQAATATQAYRMMVQKTGEATAQALLRTELDRLLPRFRERWEGTLASVYAEHFAVHELQSMRDETGASKHFDAPAAKQDAFGLSMQEKSTPLLNEYAGEALQSAADRTAMAK